MNKLTALASAVALSVVAGTALAAPVSGFGNNNSQAQYTTQGPAGFGGANAAPQSVQQVLANGYDDQRVTLTGRLTNYLGHDRYEFADDTGRIEVELDDDRDWSHISKDQQITIFGKVDREHRYVKIDVKDARPAQ